MEPPEDDCNWKDKQSEILVGDQPSGPQPVEQNATRSIMQRMGIPFGADGFAPLDAGSDSPYKGFVGGIRSLLGRFGSKSNLHAPQQDV